VEESLAEIDRCARERNFAEPTDFAVGVFDRGDGTLLGMVGLHRMRLESADGEVGYWTRADRQGRGIATEATSAFVTSLFRDWGVRRIRIRCDAGNRPSRRVPERLGMRLEALEREVEWNEDLGWRDEATYAVLARDWDPSEGRARAESVGPATPRETAGRKGFGATDPRIPPYVERLLEPEDDLLREVRERSAAAGLPPIAVGPFDGRHLEVIARGAGARRIVEIGTLGGYSGICLARALPPGGTLDTFEAVPRHAAVAEESFRRAGVADRVRIHLGRALDLLPEIEPRGPFDLVFVDADKAAYPDYLAWAERNLRLGGLLLADNVFRRAAFPVEGDDPRNAEGIRRFNESLARSGRFRATMLPIEDGLAVGVRIS
jgi:caffeoyl-CoA O-methyltransferase